MDAEQSSPHGEIVSVAGAGPAGLAAAITLARAGRRVVVHEAHAEVGHRFRSDFQGLENWTTQEDVLEALERLGMTTAFKRVPCTTGVAFDARGRSYRIASQAPVFYIVERGPGSGTLDTALLAQARALGVEVRFRDRVARIEGAGILAAGPRAVDALALGYHFETDTADGYWVICDNALAPRGYAYLLVMRGRGTLKTCMFDGFEQASLHLRRTVDAFERRVGLRMRNPRRHGGIGNFGIPRSAYAGPHPVAGEQAGFQDSLWGFGIRYAIASGVLAARSLLEGADYDALWRRELEPGLRVAVVNGALYRAFGNPGYAWLLRGIERSGDARRFLHAWYRPSRLSRALFPWARRRHGGRPDRPRARLRPA